MSATTTRRSTSLPAWRRTSWRRRCTRRPRPKSRSSFATGNPGTRTSRQAAAGLRPGDKFGDPFGVFAKYRHRQAQKPAAERVKPLHEQDRRALETLGIVGQAKSEDIKRAYKTLVKIHHPDANGGDKSSEERLRTIIAAYSPSQEDRVRGEVAATLVHELGGPRIARFPLRGTSRLSNRTCRPVPTASVTMLL